MDELNVPTLIVPILLFNEELKSNKLPLNSLNEVEPVWYKEPVIVNTSDCWSPKLFEPLLKITEELYIIVCNSYA